MYRTLGFATGLAALSFLPVQATAEVSLSAIFTACEASVVQNTPAPLLALGAVLDQNDRQQRIRLDTEAGTLLATVFPPPSGAVRGCILWGSHPDLKAEFARDWQDWVTWDEAELAARTWHQEQLAAPGRVDLTDNARPGFVVARCDVLETGIVLANQPMVTGGIRQVLPALDPPPSPQTFFQFSVMRALPGRCQAAVTAGH
ncbi:hypothetical protein [Pacificoceanicola onchidii]|uniref:hypothetical protein n=1 Tax=Pacificoceanicola onchidii TaxID=2562685 RepID=UPI0010A60793|nr:hypothetical protein [Pacificoceanicola onchidii]